MPTIKIDDTSYDTDTFSTEAKQELLMLQAAEQEIHRLNTQLAIAKTARVAYLRALKSAIAAKA